MKNLYKAFPPGWSNILLPTHRRGATLAGIATYTPCAPKGVWGQRVAWSLVSVGGARLLPGRRSAWQPPVPAQEWNTLLADLRAIAGSFDSHTVYERRRGRKGLLMLLLDGDDPVAFVKAEEGKAPGILAEESALLLVERFDAKAFKTPRVLGSGIVAGWRYLVSSPMPPRMHRMVEGAPAEAILEEIAAVLSSREPPQALPDGWEPFHGDFTPWNLRQIGDATPWLIDWEETGWAPPNADRVFYAATAYALGRPTTNEPLTRSEAAAYWWEEVNKRVQAKLDAGLELRPLDHGMLEALSVGGH